MKKLNYLLLGAVGLTLASCSNEESVFSIDKGDGNFHVTVSLPETMKTRVAAESFGEGTVADQLNIAVYDVADGSLLEESLAVFPQGQLSTTVDFNLVSGKSYNIVFFAQSEASMNSAAEGDESNAVYEFNATAKTMTVNYNNMTSENNLADAYDCFYNVLATGKIGSEGVTTSVTLNRPVGQVNWGTDDLVYNDENGETQQMVAAHDEAYGANGQYIQTNLTVSKPYTVLSLLDGVVSGNNEEVTISGMAAPYQVSFPMEIEGDTLIYIAMTYLLAPSENSTLYDLNLNVDNGGETADGSTSPGSVNAEVPVNGVPVQANYQTNIYGNLLSDDVIVNVTKNEVWNEPSYDLPQGNVVESGLYLDGTTYTIMSPAGLEAYAKIANAATQQGMSAYTVVLGADLNMSGVTHTPFSNAGATFDGQGHTVSNLTVNVANKTDAQGNGQSAGFMSSAIGTVQNINFVNCNISGSYKAGVLAGDGLVAKIENVTVTNCNVLSTPFMKNGQYDDGNNVGGIVGYLSSEPTAYVKNCTVTGSAIVGFRKVGGIVGFVQGNGTISDCNISNTTISADLTQNYYGSYTVESNELVGVIASNGNDNPGTQYNTGNTIGEDVYTYILAPKVNDEIQLNDLTDLQNLAAIVNAGRSYSGQNVTLQNDITLTDVNWTPIGKSGKPFSGNFDGNNHTVTGLTVGDENTSDVGFFGYTTVGTIQNLKFEDANVTGYLNVGVVAGTPYTAKYSNIEITGNIQVNGYSYVGGAFGKNTYANVSNITIKADEGSAVRANSENYRTYVGGIVGFTGEGNITYSGLTSNIDVYGSTCDIGGITGIAHYNTTWENCTCTGNVYVTAATDEDEVFEVGGIAGVWHNQNNTTVTFTDCEFKGTLNSNLTPAIGLEAWQKLNAITGLAYSANGGGTLTINGDDVTQEHLTIPTE